MVFKKSTYCYISETEAVEMHLCLGGADITPPWATRDYLALCYASIWVSAFIGYE